MKEVVRSIEATERAREELTEIEAAFYGRALPAMRSGVRAGYHKGRAHGKRDEIIIQPMYGVVWPG